MFVVDVMIVNVALSHMAGGLHASLQELQWLLDLAAPVLPSPP